MPRCHKCGQSNPEIARFCLACGAELGEESRRGADVRRTVTVVFADIVGSTSLVEELEPESLRWVMDRYFESMREVVERHGGTVEKFIGDAVMAVFGIPVLHEDDALRAVRASAEMREALARLNAEFESALGAEIRMRVGVETGEVVAGDPVGGQAFATGDAVNLAARLEEAAQPGEILVGASTQRLVRDAATVERVGPIALKGRSADVTAFRLVAIGPDPRGTSRRLESRFVGREAELKRLSEAFVGVLTERSCRLVTVIGGAGIGKSRLVDEFLATRADEATILRGRCLPYGEGITFWPLKEVVSEAAGLTGEEPAETAREKIRELVQGAKDAGLIVERIAETIGLAEAVQEHRGSLWAVRRLLEELTRRRPLIAVFDDIQWAEATFLDLLEYVADGPTETPILLLCMARPELLDVRPAWARREANATSIFLEPLSDDECERLIGNLLGGGELAGAARSKIVEAADGLPLFVEEMVAMLIEDGALRRENGRWVAGDAARVSTPATIHALLAARLDRLSAEERALLERGSVEGLVFHRGAVVHLSPESERSEVDDRLTELTLRELIRPEAAAFADEDAFRFHHLLLRDVAYESLRKEERVALHERLSTWLEEKAGERAGEYDEILGYHLERAYRYESELRADGAGDGELAERAAERLGSAGLRAHARGDWSAAASLLSRAVGLLPQDSGARAKLASKLDDALLEIAAPKLTFLASVRCYWRWPVGHRWTARERHGDLVLRCVKCGKEKLRQPTPRRRRPV